jgi:hypothetical protein
VVEDVRRLGGFGIVAHPDSPKPALAWREWKAQPDGIEWLNADTEWRNDSWASLARSLLGYPARPAQALASILDRPSAALDRWDAATARRRVAAFAGHDAHGGPGRSQEEARRFGLTSIPSYEASFRSFAMRAVLRTPPTGSAREDGALLLDALRAGRSYTAIDSIAAPAWLEFHAERGGHRAEMGELLGGQGAARIVIRVPALTGSVVVLLRNGVVLSESQGGEVTSPVAGPGAYRVEVAPSKRDRRAPWILSNPIYVDLPAPEPPPASPQVTDVVPLTTAGWTTEHDPGSVATVVEEGGRKGMAFELRPVSTSPFAALAAPLASPPPDFDSILVDITSSAPARLSIQFRSADGSARWKRSIYVGPDARPVVLRAADFLSAERGGRAFDPRAAASVLVVADLVNSIPGTSGRFFVRRLALTRQSF